MPSLQNYKKMLGTFQTNGQVRKNQSDIIMEQSWNEDIASVKAYLFDYYHDKEKFKFYDIHPEDWGNVVPIDIKVSIAGYTSENKDIIGKHIMFKPSFRWENENSLAYYHKAFFDKYGAEFPVGLYCAFKDEKGIYRKWLITEIATAYDLQFPTWYMLPCDYLFQWVFDHKMYSMCGVSRSQNSYSCALHKGNLMSKVL